MPTATAVTPMPLSHSRMQTFQCPYRAQQVYIKKRKEPESIPLLRGQLGHEILHAYTQHCINENTRSDPAALPGTFRAAWERANLPADEMEDLKTACKNAVEILSINPYTEAELKVAITDKYKETNWFGADVWFRGIIDRMDVLGSKGVITDYYFGWGKAEAKKAQVRLYAMIGNVLYPDVGEWTLKIFGCQTRSEAVQEISVAEIPKIRADLESEHRKVQKIIEEGKFPAIAGDHCGFCGFSQECPIQNLDVLNVGNRETALAALQKVLVMQKEVDRIKTMLKTYTGASGPLGLNGMVAGHHQTESKEWDKEEVFQAVKSQGEDPWHYFNVNGYKNKKLADMGLEPEIKYSTRFSIKKGEL